MTDETVARLHALLTTPDPPDLSGRGARVTQPGRSDRRQTVLLPLLTRWAQYRHLRVDPAPYIAPAKLQRLRLWLARRRA